MFIYKHLTDFSASSSFPSHHNNSANDAFSLSLLDGENGDTDIPSDSNGVTTSARGETALPLRLLHMRSRVALCSPQRLLHPRLLFLRRLRYLSPHKTPPSVLVQVLLQ